MLCLGGFGKGVANFGNVAQQHRATAHVGDHHAAQVVAGGKLSVGLDVERMVTDVHRTGGNVDILGGDQAPQRLDRQAVSSELVGIYIDLHLTHRRPHDSHGADAVDAVEGVHQFFIEDFRERRIAFVGRHA